MGHSKYFLLMMGLAYGAAEARAEIKWAGGLGVRHVIRKADDGLNAKDANGRDTSALTNKLWALKGNLGFTDGHERLDWGLGLRTYSSATSEWLTLQNGSDLVFRLEQAYFRPKFTFGEVSAAVTVGRQKTVLLSEGTVQTLFDRDVRWDGFGWTAKMGSFGLNLAQYILGARNQGTAAQTSAYSETAATRADPATQSDFGKLIAFQPTFQWTVSEQVKALFALSYLHWDAQGTNTSHWFTNALHGGTTNSSANVAVGDVNPLIMDNPRQLHFFTEWTLPYYFKLSAEYVRNKKVYYGTSGVFQLSPADRDAWAATIAYGAAKKKGEFSLSYAYGDKGHASVVNTFTNGDASADNTGHFAEGKYMVENGLSVTGKAIFLAEKSRVGGDGLSLTSPNQGRRQKLSRYEFVTALSF